MDSDSALVIEVPASLDGVRLDKAVALVADVSRSEVNALIAEGRITVDGLPVRTRSTPLRSGQQLRVNRRLPESELPEPDPTVGFDVVYEDAQLIVVDKPAGLVVHPAPGHRTATLVNGLLDRFPDLASLAEEGGVAVDRPGIVHRLDRGTSGLMVVARTPAAYRSLVAQLEDRSVSRVYRALVFGHVEEQSGMVDAPIGRSTSAPTRMAVSPRGKEARTRYQVEARYSLPTPTTLLTAMLETGRTHQIRVHLSAIGHPVVADQVYGRGRRLPGSTLARPFLHARSLALVHPETGTAMSWTSELPADLVEELAKLSA
jgi:23S rRNA pseudouridine1911/1915/1917 synthase